MVELKGKLGSVKRFGVRYGRSLKTKLALIEVEQRDSYKCPRCHSKSVKRIAAGIWHCEKCGRKMTGRAYSLSESGAKKAVEEKAEEQAAGAE